MSTFGTGTFGEGRFGDPSYEFVDGQYKRVAWKVRWDEGYEGKIGFAVPELEDMRYAAPQMEQGELPTAFALNPDDLLPGRVEGGGGLGHIAADTITTPDLQAHSIDAGVVIATESITGPLIKAGEIDATHLNVVSLDAITGRMGTLAAGVITLDGSTLLPASGSGEDLSALIQTSETNPKVTFDESGLIKTSADGTTAFSIGPDENILIGAPVSTPVEHLIDDFNSHANGSLTGKTSPLGSDWAAIGGYSAFQVAGTSPNKYAGAATSGTSAVQYANSLPAPTIDLTKASTTIVEFDVGVGSTDTSGSNYIHARVDIDDVSVTLTHVITAVGTISYVNAYNRADYALGAIPLAGSATIPTLTGGGAGAAHIHEVRIEINTAIKGVYNIRFYVGGVLQSTRSIQVDDTAPGGIGARVSASLQRSTGTNHSVNIKSIKHYLYTDDYDDRKIVWDRAGTPGTTAEIIASQDVSGSSSLTPRNLLKLASHSPSGLSSTELSLLTYDDKSLLQLSAGDEKMMLFDSDGDSHLYTRPQVAMRYRSGSIAGLSSNTWHSIGVPSGTVFNYGREDIPKPGFFSPNWVFPIPGIYLVTWNLQWDNTAQGWARHAEILYNNSTLVMSQTTETTTGLGIYTRQSLSHVFYADAEDYIVCRVHFQSGASFNYTLTLSELSITCLESRVTSIRTT